MFLGRLFDERILTYEDRDADALRLENELQLDPPVYAAGMWAAAIGTVIFFGIGIGAFAKEYRLHRPDHTPKRDDFGVDARMP